jgi:hypothetical protein
MKKIYLQPSTEMVILGTTTIICGSQDITSDNGIDYGGVDEDGTKDPASRRQRNEWEDEEEEELY